MLIQALRLSALIVCYALANTLLASQVSPAVEIPFGRLPSQYFSPSEIGLNFNTHLDKIVEAQDKCIYVATSDGIARYDGIRWKIIDVLKKSLWVDLHFPIGKDKLLYSDTEDNFYLLSIRDFSSKPIAFKEKPHEWQNTRVVGARDVAYLSLDDKTFKLNENSSLFELVFDGKRARGVAGQYHIFFDCEQRNYQLYRFTGGALEHLSDLDVWNIRDVWSLASQPGFLFAASQTLVYKINLEDFSIESHEFTHPFVLKYRSIPIGQDRIAMCTASDGVMVFNYQGELVDRICIQNSELKSNVIKSLAFDYQHGLWIASGKGLLRAQFGVPTRIFDGLYANQSYIYDVLNVGQKIYMGHQLGYTKLERSNEGGLPSFSSVFKQHQSVTRIPNIVSLDGEVLLFGKNAPLNEHFIPVQFPRKDAHWYVKEFEFDPTRNLAYLTTFPDESQTFVYEKSPDGYRYLTCSKLSDIGLYKTDLDSRGNLWGTSRLGAAVVVSVAAIQQSNPENPFGFEIISGIPTLSSNTLEVGVDEVIVASQKSLYRASIETLTAEPVLVRELEGLPPEALISRVSHIKDHQYLLSIAIEGKHFHKTVDTEQGRFIDDYHHLSALDGFQYVVSEKDRDLNTWVFGFSDAVKIDWKTTPEKFPLASIGIDALSIGDQTLITNDFDSLAQDFGSFAYDANNLQLRLSFPSYISRYREQSSNQFYFTVNGERANMISNSDGAFRTISLKPDSYDLLIEAEDAFGRRAGAMTISFQILPPWYQSKLAVIIYSVLIILVFGVILKWRLQAQRDKLWFDRLQMERQLNLESAAKEAQIQALRLQLNPHFLFNSLTLIANKLTGVPDAKESILRLSLFLRHTLEEKNSQMVPLEKEIEAVHQYLAIEHLKSQGSIEVTFQIDPETKSIPVPGLIIQPLIENAIKYSKPNESGKKQIALKARVANNFLELIVRNSGSWASGSSSTSIGLQNIAKRLDLQYGKQAKLVSPEDTEKMNEVVVKMLIPL